jgi:tetratricopeptide (TPR) repeat protein
MDSALARTTASLPAIALAAAMLVAGCASPPPAPSAPAGAPAPPVEAPPQSAAPAAPDLTPAQAKAQAQKLALEAVDHLQNGDEPGARQALGTALGLDPANDLARKMSEQISADAQKELGPVFFRYTVQRDDSLSKLAQQYLGDRFRFYILARYNDMANPSRLAAGQVIKIPGKAPPSSAAPPRAPGAPSESAEAAPAAPAAEPVPAAGQDFAALMQKGRRLQASGDLQGAYAAFSEAVAHTPGNRDAILQRDAARTALIRSYDREATQAFQRQNLDLAIAKWDRLLELDPGNQKAKLERERALELKKKMNEKFGAK